MSDIHEFAPWPDSETGTADQLARCEAVQTLWSFGRMQATTAGSAEHARSVDSAVHSYTIGRLLRELVDIDPERANTVTRELLEAYIDGVTPLWEPRDWLAEYGLDSNGIADAGAKAAKEASDE